MDVIVKKAIEITNELLDPNSSLKDMELVKKLRVLEELLVRIEKSGRWQKIGFPYNDLQLTIKVVKRGESCRKRRTIEQFYRQYGQFQLKEYLSTLKDRLESYFKQ